jgi:YD repeat-containing protein
VYYRYTAQGQLREVVDLGGKSWYYEYDERGRMKRAVDPLRHVSFDVVYDDQGRATEVKSPTGPARYEYDETLRQTRVIDGNGYESLYRQNEAGITVGIRNPLGVETALVLDGRNRVETLLRNDAVRAEMSYDDRGRLISLVKHDGDRPERMDYTYDDRGRLVEIQKAEGSVMLDYDKPGNLLERVDADGVTQYSHSRQGDLLAMSLPEGRSYRFEVDADGQMASVVDQWNRRTSFRYDKNGRLSQTRFADGTTRAYFYDRLGMRRLIEFGTGAAVEYQYNVAGSLTEIQIRNADGALNGQQLTLDETQKVRFIEFLTGGEAHLTYDRMGNVTTAMVGNRTTRFTYDELNRLREVITADGKRLRYEYGEGEADIRLQMDHHSGQNVSERITSGLTFSSGWELLKNRTERRSLSVIRLDPAMGEYHLASDDGMVLSDAAAMSGMARIRVMDLGQSTSTQKNTFDAPSNVLFIPAEYWAVNCCPQCEGVEGCMCMPDEEEDEGGGWGLQCCSGRYWITEYCEDCLETYFVCAGDCVPGVNCTCKNFQKYCHIPSLFCLVYTSKCNKIWPCRTP